MCWNYCKSKCGKEGLRAEVRHRHAREVINHQWAYEACVGEPDEEVAEWRWVQDASVVEHNERRRVPSVPKPVLLCLGGQLVQQGRPMCVVLPLVRDEIGRPHSAMRPYEAARDLTRVEQAHEKWPRDLEEVGRLLRRQLRLDRDDGDRVPIRHLAQDLQERLERLTRNRDRNRTPFALWLDLYRTRGLSARKGSKRTQRDLRFFRRLGGGQLHGGGLHIVTEPADNRNK